MARKMIECAPSMEDTVIPVASRFANRYHRCMKRLVAVLILMMATGRFAFADEVDALIKSEMEKHQITGLSLMVVRDGRQVKTGSYGVANLEWNVPVTPDTVFEIGSITKQVTAACILLLAEDGKLAIDDKLSQHMANTPPAWSNITI